MKQFKHIDLWLSIILIVGFAIISLIRFDQTFIYGYFFVGGWQVISMMVHGFNPNYSCSIRRESYHMVVACTIGLTLLLLLVPSVSLLLPSALLLFGLLWPFIIPGYATRRYIFS